MNRLCLRLVEQRAETLEHDAHVEPEPPVAAVPDIGLCAVLALSREVEASDAGFEVAAGGEELPHLFAVVVVVLRQHRLRADNRHAAPKDAQELRQQFEPRVLQELSEGEVTRISRAVEEGRGFLVVPSTEGEAQELLAVHAAEMSGRKDRSVALPLDANVGNQGEGRKDGEQDDEAQHDVRQTFDYSVGYAS